MSVDQLVKLRDSFYLLWREKHVRVGNFQEKTIPPILCALCHYLFGVSMYTHYLDIEGRQISKKKQLEFRS